MAEERLYDQEADLREKYILRNKKGFRHSLLTYVGVNLILAFLSLSQGEYWFLFSVFGWGLAVALEAPYAFRTSGPGFEAAFNAWHDGQVAAAFDPQHDIMLQAYCRDVVERSESTIPRLATVKWFREQTGLSLKHSVEIVERFARQNPQYFFP